MPTKRWIWGALALISLAVGFAVLPRKTGQASAAQTGARQAPTTSFRILFGLGDREPTRWDGKVDLTGGKIVSVSGWRFAEDDTSGDRTWKLGSRRGLPPVGRGNLGQPG